MTEAELRALVRQAIARYTDGCAGRLPSEPPAVHLGPAHAMFAVPTGADADGPCIIEPAVMCNHCGYCKSMGH